MRMFAECSTPEQPNEVKSAIDTNSASTVDINELEHFIDDFVISKISDFEPPGMTVAVVMGDQQITKGYGIAHAEAGERNVLLRVAPAG
jgi:CubicO group peptidase (beta-lactamase class C family)